MLNQVDCDGKTGSQVNNCWQTSMSCSIIKNVTPRFTTVCVRKDRDSKCSCVSGLWWRTSLFTGYRWNKSVQYKVKSKRLAMTHSLKQKHILSCWIWSVFLWHLLSYQNKSVKLKTLQQKWDSAALLETYNALHTVPKSLCVIWQNRSHNQRLRWR